jgi:two-component system, OmpR family, KDP operon response regulator KdpE
MTLDEFKGSQSQAEQCFTDSFLLEIIYISGVDPSPGASVLVVEDNSDLRALFRLALTMAGFRVREAHDGYHALVAYEEDPPAVIVLDLGLPRVSGFTVLEEVTARQDLPQPAVVVVTGLDGVDHLQATVLRKPVEPSALVATVKSVLRRAGSGTTV